jgi:hypothetical protein
MRLNDIEFAQFYFGIQTANNKPNKWGGLAIADYYSALGGRFSVKQDEAFLQLSGMIDKWLTKRGENFEVDTYIANRVFTHEGKLVIVDPFRQKGKVRFDMGNFGS